MEPEMHVDLNQPVDETSDRWMAAVHEAGHAVAAAKLGLAIPRATLDIPAATAGYFKGCVFTCGGTPQQNAVVALAGPLAEMVLSPSNTALDKGDMANARQFALDLPQACADAAAIVRNYAESIRDIAKVLFATGEIDGSAVRAILNGEWQDGALYLEADDRGVYQHEPL